MARPHLSQQSSSSSSSMHAAHLNDGVALVDELARFGHRTEAAEPCTCQHCRWSTQ